MISATKINLVIIFILIGLTKTFAQDSFQQQFDLAKKLYDEEKYFDAVTEFKRLLYFDKSGNYDYEANMLMGNSYKQGAKFSDAIQHFSEAGMNAKKNEEVFESKIEIIKINILRRTTDRALKLLENLEADKRFNTNHAEINYWRGWTYIFADDWEKASQEFALIDSTHFLKTFCDSVGNDLYNVTLAKALSIIPGLGQFYTGEYVSGFISLGWNVLWGYLTVNALSEDRIFDGIMVGTLLWYRFYNGNLQNAEKFAQRKNLEKTNAAMRYLQNQYNGSKL